MHSKHGNHFKFSMVNVTRKGVGRGERDYIDHSTNTRTFGLTKQMR
jgi:hypothetical protein